MLPVPYPKNNKIIKYFKNYSFLKYETCRTQILANKNNFVSKLIKTVDNKLFGYLDAIWYHQKLGPWGWQYLLLSSCSCCCSCCWRSIIAALAIVCPKWPSEKVCRYCAVVTWKTLLGFFICLVILNFCLLVSCFR